MGIIFRKINTLLIDWDFDSCKIELCDFNGLDIRSSDFLDCTIRETDFLNANLKESVFSGSDLKTAKFHNTNLEKVNFVGAKNFAIDPTQNKMKGAKFSYADAVGLLGVFEIEIE